MEQYIPKSALLAEIEKLYDEKGAFYAADVLYDLKEYLDTLEVKEVGIWKTVDNINSPQADRNKIYCVITKHEFVSKNKYLTASVVNHPQDEDLLQWKCTEFPFRCYDMCEGDKYLQIV